MPSFSVIIPTYGRPVFLADALRSVAQQTIENVEVIVVDDASPVPVQLPAGSRAHLIRAKENGGAASARNLGAATASGDVLTFLDDDDTWLPTRLEDAARGVAQAPIGISGQGGAPRRLYGNVHDTILDATTPHLGATAIRREHWHPLNEEYRTCEDLVWWLEATRESEVYTVDRQGLRVRRHPGLRLGYGAEQRIADSLRLLDEFDDYFDSHPRAAAHRFRRIGLMQRAVGDLDGARRSHRAALRRRPNPRDLKHLVAALPWPSVLTSRRQHDTQRQG